MLGGLVGLWAAALVVNRSLRSVTGRSMLPALRPGDVVAVLPSWLRRPRRGDVVIAADPRGGHGSELATVKRLVGLPGEHITLHPAVVEADGRPAWTRPEPDAMAPVRSWQLGEHEYLLLGDNPPRSTDSRVFGPVAAGCLQAVVVWRLRPWGRVT